jgi:hypothetical protein
MMTSLLAKIAGWAMFSISAANQLFSQGVPHGVFGWLTLIGSGLAALGIHAASNTSGTH